MRARPLRLAFLALLLGAGTARAQSEAPPLSAEVLRYEPEEARAWTALAPLPFPLASPATAWGAGTLYVLGGERADGAAVRPSAEGFSLETAGGAWRALPPLPVPAAGARAAVLDGTLYLAGGWDDSGGDARFFAGLHALPAGAGAWERRSPMAAPRSDFALLAEGGALYAVGGKAEGPFDRFYAEAERYDPAADRWTPVAPMPKPAAYAAGAALGGALYVLGGEGGPGEPEFLARAFRYDPAADRWTRVADMPRARKGHVAAAIGGRLYVFGGRGPREGREANLPEIDVYDPAADAWTTVGEQPRPTAFGAAAGDGAGGAILVGGEREAEEPLERRYENAIVKWGLTAMLLALLVLSALPERGAAERG